MSSSVANVGEARISLVIVNKDVQSQLEKISTTMEKGGNKSGVSFANAWNVAMGSLIHKGISKVISTVTSHLDSAVSRVDTLNNFPKVMTNLGVATEESAEAISTMSDKLQGLPTNLDEGAAAVQRFTSKNGDVKKSTSMFLALNNAILAGGMSADIQSTAIEQISQAYAKGKPDMMEWRAMQTAMPAQLNQISKAMFSNEDALNRYMEAADKYAKDNPMSSTASELVEQLEGVKNGTFDMTTAMGTALRTGVISMDEFIDTIQKLNENGVDGLANFEKQAKDTTGGIQTAIAVMNSRITQGIAAVINEIGSENIAGIAEGIGNAVKTVGQIIAVVVNFVAEHWNVFSPIFATLAGVAGTIVAITVALKAYKKVQTAINAIHAVFKKGLTGIQTGITKVSNTIQKSPIGSGAEKIGSVFSRLANTISSAIKNIGEILKNLAQAITEPLKTALKGIGEALANFFTALANPAIIMGALSFVAVAGSIAASIWLIGSAVGAIMPVLTDLFDNIIMPIANFIATTVLNLIDAVTNAVVVLTQNALIPLGEFLTGVFVTILTTISEVITSLTQNAVVPLINTLSGAFMGIVQSVANLLAGVLNVALQGIASIVSAVGDGFLKMGQAIKTALEGVQGVLSAFADVIKAIASAAVAMVSLVTGRSINYGAGYAHLFASGGKVEGPGSATSDSIPAMLSNGEYVINAGTAREIGYDTLDALNEGNYHSLAGMISDFEDDGAGASRSNDNNVTVYMTNQISNKLDAQEIGQIMVQSIRRAV